MAAAAGSLVGLFRRERSFRRFKQKGRNLLREKEVNLLGTVLRFESQGSCTLGTYDHLLYASPFGWQWKLEELVEKYSSEDQKSIRMSELRKDAYLVGKNERELFIFHTLKSNQRKRVDIQKYEAGKGEKVNESAEIKARWQRRGHHAGRRASGMWSEIETESQELAHVTTTISEKLENSFIL